MDAIPNAELGQLTVTTGSQGVEIVVPFSQPKGTKLHATIAPHLDAGKVTLDLADLRLVGGTGVTAHIAEAVLRAQLRDNSALRYQLDDIVRQVDGKSWIIPLDGGTQIIGQFGKMSVKQMVTSDAGVTVRITAIGQVAVQQVSTAGGASSSASAAQVEPPLQTRTTTIARTTIAHHRIQCEDNDVHIRLPR